MFSFEKGYSDPSLEALTPDNCYRVSLFSQDRGNQREPDFMLVRALAVKIGKYIVDNYSFFFKPRTLAKIVIGILIIYLVIQSSTGSIFLSILSGVK